MALPARSLLALRASGVVRPGSSRPILISEVVNDEEAMVGARHRGARHARSACENEPGGDAASGRPEGSAKAGAKGTDGEPSLTSAGSTRSGARSDGATPRSKADPGAVDIAGSYTLSGKDALGRRIAGTVEIRPNRKGNAGSYLISRVENGKKLRGVMYVDGRRVFASWSRKGAGLRALKLVGGDTLEGPYFGSTEPRVSTETLRGGSSEMSGRYRIKDSVFASGDRYSGTVSIEADDDIYKLKYKLSYSGRREKFTAYGLRADDMLGVATHAGGPFGFALYTLSDDGLLQGRMGRSSESAEGRGEETLRRN
jgi:hypothetical protein